MKLGLAVVLQNMIFFLIDAYICVKIYLARTNYLGNRPFSRVAFSTAILQLSAGLLMAEEYDLVYYPRFVVNFLDMAVIFMTAQQARFAFKYLYYICNGKERNELWWEIICMIPSTILLVTCLVSPWTHWVFYVDEQLVYHRGTMFFLQIICPYSYVLGAIWLMIQGFRGKDSSNMRVARNATLLVIPCAIGSLLQVAFNLNGGYSMIGTSISMILMYLELYVNEMKKIEYLQGLETLNTELMELNQRLEAARNEAQIANEAKTRFLFNMSHDMRTPMNAITGFLNLMRKNVENPDRLKEYLGKMEVSSRYLLELIDYVLEMSRIESGKETLREEIWDAKEFNDVLTDIFEEQARQKQIAFTRTIRVNHTDVWCDSTKVQKIYLNILNNALKYTPVGGRISMDLTEIESNREGYAMYQTVITDTGIGISEEFLPHIFENFAREKSTTESKIPGTGLGMSIVKSLVELMGGTIQIESKLGEGTKVTTILPHRIAEAGVHRANMVESIEANYDESVFRGKHLLLAEDNELNAEIAMELLKELGCTVDHAEDGLTCVKMMNEAPNGRYDLILMDVQMPKLDGYGATEKIRSLEDRGKAAIPIVAMTANAFEDDRREAYKCGMNGFVAKPINIEQMKKTLAALLGA